MTLIVIAVVILYEAIERFKNPQPVESTWMFISASVGLVMNLYLGLGLRKEDNINVKSAVLHMIGDAMASAGVIIGGFVILFTGWDIVDPVLSVLIALLIAAGAWDSKTNNRNFNGGNSKRNFFKRNNRQTSVS